MGWWYTLDVVTEEQDFVHLHAHLFGDELVASLLHFWSGVDSIVVAFEQGI